MSIYVLNNVFFPVEGESMRPTRVSQDFMIDSWNLLADFTGLINLSKIFKSFFAVIGEIGSKDSVEKGCIKASFSFILYCFFGYNKRLIKSLQFLLTFLKGDGEKSYSHFFIF